MRQLIYLIIIGTILNSACNVGKTSPEDRIKSQKELEAVRVIKKLQKAMNAQNLEGMLACVDTGYISENHNYPERGFSGRIHMQENWTGILSDYPDFHCDLKRYAVSNDTIWVEWYWKDSSADNAHFIMTGVAIFKVEGGRITVGRLFMSPVD